MIKRLLILTALMVSSFAPSNADTVIIPDTPNVGDFTTVVTTTVGNIVTTNNLISQNFADGTWNGTMFPDNSDLDDSTWLTGKEGKYAETSINSEDYVSLEELRMGFTSNFGAQIRWWNNVESTVTMTQSISNGIDTTTQSTTFEDTTNYSYIVNPYGNTLIVNPDANMAHGTATYRFDFDIINDNEAGYNGGHAGVDVRDPTAIIDYTALTTTTTSTITYCWQQSPPTCPGQDEIDAVENIIDSIDVDTIIEDIVIEEIDTYIPETILYIPEEIELDEIDYYESIPIKFEVAYVPDLETIIIVDAPDVEMNIDMNIDMDIPDMSIDTSVDLSMPEDVDMEMFDMEVVDTDELVSMFTSEPEIIEDAPIEEITEPVMIAATEPETISEPEPEPIPEDKPIQEVVMEEEPVNEPEEQPEVEEQPSSEEFVADEPTPEPDNPEQEEIVEESIEPQPEPTMEEDIKVVEEKPRVNIDVAKIEQAIKEQVTNKVQQIAATLDVVSEVLSREISAQQPDLSSYTALNAAMIDNRQLPGGNPAFFDQISLESYNKIIYNDPTKILAMIGVDPVVEHTKKVNAARTKTNEAYYKLKALLEAQNVK